MAVGIGCDNPTDPVIEDHYVAIYKRADARVALPLDVSVNDFLYKIVRKWGDTITVKDGSVVNISFHHDGSTAYYNNTFTVTDNMTVYVGQQ